MNRALAEEIRNLGGDVGDPVWRWLVLNGPHGSGFTWAQTRRQPAGYVGVEHLQRIVAERTEDDSDFPAKARGMLQKAFFSRDPIILRRAIQVAAVVGEDAEAQLVNRLKAHENAAVAADARACAFYLRKRLRAERW